MPKCVDGSEWSGHLFIAALLNIAGNPEGLLVSQGDGKPLVEHIIETGFLSSITVNGITPKLLTSSKTHKPEQIVVWRQTAAEEI